MKKFLIIYLLIGLTVLPPLFSNHSPSLLPSTEGDPQSFIEHCINVINGDFCESSTDLSIPGSDVLCLQRYYNAKNYFTGEGSGAWRILPKLFLVVGHDPMGQTSKSSKNSVAKSIAFVGENSGGILVYSGFLQSDGTSESPLKINIKENGLGIVNTYVKSISGQTNHKNNLLYCKKNSCEIHAGDGTIRFYEKVPTLSNLIFGEELTSEMHKKVLNSVNFHLIEELLPSGNRIIYTYDKDGHISKMEMKNSTKSKTHSWISFTYSIENKQYMVAITSSDNQQIEYQFEKVQFSNNLTNYTLTNIKGSHVIPISYQYQENGNYYSIVKKILPKSSLTISYDAKGRVKSLQEDDFETKQSFVKYTFSYDNKCTEVFDANGIKTRYSFNDRLELTEIAKFDKKNILYRIDTKVWGMDANSGQLVSSLVADGNQSIHSYCSYTYDLQGNVVEESLYGNLSGKKDVQLQIDSSFKLLDPNKIECHRIKKTYSQDRFNLLLSIGDTGKTQTIFQYKDKTNLLTKELIFSEGKIRKRIFITYDEDGSKIKTVIDDGSSKEENYLLGATERHITSIKPKQFFPCIGTPEIIEEKSWDFSGNQEVLLRRCVNEFDSQGHPIKSTFYDAEGRLVYSEMKKYDKKGLLISEIDRIGQEKFYAYDSIGNCISINIPHEHKIVLYKYDCKNRIICESENIDEQSLSSECKYDSMGNKISTKDEFGNTTQYEYDEFGRLSCTISPEVYDENQKIITPTVHFSYDIFNNQISFTDPCNYTTFQTNNIRGNPIKILYPDDSKEYFKYDLGGDLHRSLSREEILTYFEYDYLGRVIFKQTQQTNNKSSSDAINTFEFKYNAFQCIEKITDELTTKIVNDLHGRPISITQEDRLIVDPSTTRQKVIEYDALGRAKKNKIWFDSKPEDYSTENFEYDIFDNILEKSIKDHQDTIFNRKMYIYNNNKLQEEFEVIDGQKRLINKIHYDFQGNETVFSDHQGNETSIVIDKNFLNELGQNVAKKIIVNPNFVSTEIEHDALGRVVKIVKRDLHGNLLSSQKIFYNARGDKYLESNDKIVEGRIESVENTFCKFGPMGRIEQQIENYQTPDEFKTSYIYNSLGQLKEKFIQGYAKPLTYTYDKAGRVSNIQHSEGDSAVDQTVKCNYKYDVHGNVNKANGVNNISVSRTYNGFNQLIKENSSDGQSGNSIIEYTYDRKGRIKSIKLPDQSMIQYLYNGVHSIEIQKISSKKQLLYSHKYTSYDESGKLVTEVFAQDQPVQHCYNRAKQLQQIQSSYFEEKGFYDALGRIKTINRKGPSCNFEGTYEYNDLSQLVAEKGSNVNHFSYDSIDNKLQINGSPLVFEGNKIKSFSNITYKHDPQGNLLRKTLDSEETNYKYNILNQLVRVENNDKTVLQFYHDPFGRRLAKKHVKGLGAFAKQLSIQHFIYIGNQEIGIIDENQNILELRIPGIDDNGLSSKSVAIEIKGKPFATLHDIIGNISALIDLSSKLVIESYTYSAFGSEKIFDAWGSQIPESIFGNPWRFSEKRKDKETGWIFFGCRYYDCQLGRWTSKDPLGIADGPNPYAYVHNNPLNYFDEFGLATETNNDGVQTFYDENDRLWHTWGPPNDRYAFVTGRKRDHEISNKLPKITYCNSFENGYKKSKRSRPFDLGYTFHEYPGITFGFINGVLNDFEDAYNAALHISKLAGGANVHSVHNATHGVFMDLFECFLGLNFIATPPVTYLKEQWHKSYKEGNIMLQICHSQGAIHVRNALLDCQPEIRNNVIVLAIAPAAYIYKETCDNMMHYRVLSSRDFIPRIDILGSIRSKEYIVDLDSDVNAGVLDHEFMSPTYSEPLKNTITNFIKSQGKEI
jgi:RHS repeat-associated protein